MTAKIRPAGQAEFLHHEDFASWIKREIPDPLFIKTFNSNIKTSEKIINETLDSNEIIAQQEALSSLQIRKPFFILMQLVGGMPFTVSPGGYPYFKVLSPAFVYSFLVYVVLMVSICVHLFNTFRIDAGQVDQVIDNFVYVGFFAKYAAMPLFLWLPINKMTSFFEMWVNFLVHFKRITGTSSQYGNLRKYSTIAGILIPILCLTIVSAWVQLHMPDEKQLIPMYTVPLLTSFVFTSLWGLTYVMLGMMAQQISETLKIRLKQYQGDTELQVIAVHEHRSLWLELTRLLQGNNDVSTVTFTYHAVHVFIMLTFSLYALLSTVGTTLSAGEMAIRCFAMCLYLAELWFMANASHYSSAKFDALQWDPDWVAPDLSMPKKVVTEINMFLDVAAAAPSSVNIGGFVVINRSWLTNMLGNLISSIIILLQFRFSQEDANGSATTNSTATTLTP